MMDIREKILQLCETYGMSISNLATVCHVPRTTLQSIVNGESTNVRIQTIIKICNGLNITLADFFKK